MTAKSLTAAAATIALSLLPFVSGCSDSDTSAMVGVLDSTANVAKSVVAPPAPALSDKSRPADSSDKNAAPDQPVSEEKSEKPTEAAQSFEPPYPNRVELFLQPRMTKRVLAKRPGEISGSDVKLTGFVNVDGLCALLSIDGKIAAVKQGEERGGVKVLEIAPPKITLQRGRVRWTESLFEGPTH